MKVMVILTIFGALETTQPPPDPTRKNTRNESGRTRDQTKNKNHPDYSTLEIG